jgi:hypothetical protein
MNKAHDQRCEQRGSGAWTLQQLALVLMLFGVIAVSIAIKCLVLGPPPYSVWAYVFGPGLIVGSYLVDPYAISDLMIDVLHPPQPNPPQPPTDVGDPPPHRSEP